MTAAEALQHPWLAQITPSSTSSSSSASASRPDLLPSLRRNFDAKKTWRKAINMARAGAILKAGGEQRRATLLAEAGMGLGSQEEQMKLREQAEKAKREAEEEAVSSFAQFSLPVWCRPALFDEIGDAES
jgi:calcium/calmodulin-dependent protein kinase I